MVGQRVDIGRLTLPRTRATISRPLYHSRLHLERFRCAVTGHLRNGWRYISISLIIPRPGGFECYAWFQQLFFESAPSATIDFSVEDAPGPRKG